jgi:hypothetical protein
MQWIRRVAVIVATAVVLGGGLAGAIGISGDGIEQDDIVAADRPIRVNGDGSDHGWSVASLASKHMPPAVPYSADGARFGV